jgi:hypothetical protein
MNFHAPCREALDSLQARQAKFRRAQPLLREFVRNAVHFVLQRQAHGLVDVAAADIAAAEAVAAATGEYVRIAAARTVRARMCARVEEDEEAAALAALVLAFAGSRWGMLQRDVRIEVGTPGPGGGDEDDTSESGSVGSERARSASSSGA